jgi:UDP-2,4-diacetamido-2,4,6-trideoxy-beta-L-altropyranose hydrolase
MNLLFRTDASLAMGTGHVMRCLALGQAWQDSGGGAGFAMAESTSALRARLAAESCEIVSVSCVAGTEDDSRQTIALAQERAADWIVVDGYQFSAEYQRALKEAGFKVLFLDDFAHASHYFADLVLNQNAHAGEGMYGARESYTRLLLGPDYCLLRREFAAWRGCKRTISPVAHRLLVMMGGSDPENLTARVVDAVVLAGLEDVEATIVVGGSNPHFAALQDSVARSGQKISLLRDVSNMAELMAAADFSVSAAGSTCWELCLLGLPALLLDVAPNQTALAKELDRRGCAIQVGDQNVSVEKIADGLRRLANSREVRQSLSQHSRELVDGDGARRVVSILRGTDCGKGLHLRRARADDSRLLWEWVNDPEVRAASFSSAPISWETHGNWLAERLSQGASLLFIAEDGKGIPCGQIRFDARPDGDWEVDVSLSKTMRGRGLAGELIGLGVQEILKHNHGVRVHAFVKPANSASVKAFAKAGFKLVGNEEIRGNAAVHLIYGKKEPV